MKNNRSVAIVLENGRFFCGWDKAGRVKTSWSLAGALLFGEWRGEFVAEMEKLKAAGKKPMVAVVDVTAIESPEIENEIV